MHPVLLWAHGAFLYEFRNGSLKEAMQAANGTGHVCRALQMKHAVVEMQGLAFSPTVA